MNEGDTSIMFHKRLRYIHICTNMQGWDVDRGRNVWTGEQAEKY